MPDWNCNRSTRLNRSSRPEGKSNWRMPWFSFISANQFSLTRLRNIDVTLFSALLLSDHGSVLLEPLLFHTQRAEKRTLQEGPLLSWKKKHCQNSMVITQYTVIYSFSTERFSTVKKSLCLIRDFYSQLAHQECNIMQIHYLGWTGSVLWTDRNPDMYFILLPLGLTNQMFFNPDGETALSWWAWSLPGWPRPIHMAWQLMTLWPLHSPDINSERFRSVVLDGALHHQHQIFWKNAHCSGTAYSSGDRFRGASFIGTMCKIWAKLYDMNVAGYWRSTHL